MKKLYLLGLGILILNVCANAQTMIEAIKDNNFESSNYDSKYDYIYMNPPRTSFQAAGKYIISSSGVRYVHSPSKRKREAHAARINAYNYAYGNY